jgi:hypothetical protein
MKKDASFVLGIAGAAIVLGFFLPFLDVGALATASGWDIVMSAKFAWTTRLAVALLPVGGAVLALAGFAGAPESRKISFAIGAGILGFTTFKLAWGFLKVTGVGLWLVLAAAVVAFAVGLARAQRNV